MSLGCTKRTQREATKRQRPQPYTTPSLFGVERNLLGRFAALVRPTMVLPVTLQEPLFSKPRGRGGSHTRNGPGCTPPPSGARRMALSQREAVQLRVAGPGVPALKYIAPQPSVPDEGNDAILGQRRSARSPTPPPPPRCPRTPMAVDCHGDGR